MPSKNRVFNSTSIPRPPLLPVVADWQRFSCVDLEIGAGTGLHARDYCEKNPDRALIALEKTHTRSRQLLRTDDRALPVNLFAYQADAVAFVSHFVPDEFLDRIFILYPNPYLKSKHANLRWYNRPFMGCLLRKMRVGGTLTFATNIESYFAEAREVFAEVWRLREISACPIKDFTPRTLFEKKYLERGETCWNLVVEKPFVQEAFHPRRRG